MNDPTLLKGVQRSVERYPVYFFAKHLFQVGLRRGNIP